MRILHGLEKIREMHRGSVVTIGNFDGVHLGHQKIINAVTGEAERLGTLSLALTFEPHPVKVLMPDRGLKLITPPEQRARLILNYGVDRVLFVNFTREFASQMPDDFIRDVLVGKLGARAVIVGHNYTFGKGRRGTTELLRTRGRKFGFGVKVVRSVRMGPDVISSSRIRGLITKGRVSRASELLGRPYSIQGTVVRGAGRGGKALGTPTANLSTTNELLPPKGVYAVRAALGGRLLDGVANIGYKPTFKDSGGEEGRSYEVHLFDFNGDIRGETLKVFFVKRLREEKAFPSVEALRLRIQKDIAQARKILGGRKAPGLRLI
jgi:riboflavin kinase/FMN adenylyltransferase